MARKKWIESLGAATADRDLANWPTVNTGNMSPDQIEIFIRRKQAVDLYLKQDVTTTEISRITGIARTEIQRFVARCLELDENGEVWGYRALIHRKFIKDYHRKTPTATLESSDSPKMAGAFSMLLRTYPKIKEEIDDLYLQRKRGSTKDPVMNIKVLHKHFLNACRAQGILINEYPFNTKNLGKRSLYRYVKELENAHFSEAAKRYGEDIGRHARSTGIGIPNSPMIIRPFERVQFDGHRIDTALAITFFTPEGDEIVEVMERVWLLVIIDVATRAVLGYYLSLNKEYSASDVLQCIRNAVIPWNPKKLTIAGLQYPDNGGFASAVIPETEWALWDEFWIDNGKANLANVVRDRLTQIVGCSVNAGPVSMPERRGLIERFFRTLEENGYHRLPSTTGSNPRDPRRQNAEQKAIKYRITAEQLEELTEVLIAHYNGTPHEGINNLSPLEVMKQRIMKGEPIRQMPYEKRNEVAFLSLQVKRQVKGSVSSGKRPYIQYEGVIYRNEILSRTPDLVGTTLDLFVNIEDLRVIRAYLPDGSEFGVLTATGKWGITPHTLQDRKQINKLRNDKMLHYTTSDDPVEIYQRFLELQAKSIKRDRNRLADFQRKQKAHQKRIDTKATETNDFSIAVSNIAKIQEPREVDSVSEGRSKHPKIRKTITY